MQQVDGKEMHGGKAEKGKGLRCSIRGEIYKRAGATEKKIWNTEVQYFGGESILHVGLMRPRASGLGRIFGFLVLYSPTQLQCLYEVHMGLG
jgi:hypothetical protein